MLFKDVIGQHAIKQQLATTLKTGRIGHAQLFTGETGYGSFALALATAQYIFCTGDKEDDACGQCIACLHVQKLIHPDLHFVFPVVRKVKGKSPVSDDYIEEWRNLITKNHYFNLEEWYAEMGVDDNAQAAIYTEESGQILKKLHLKPFESDFKVMIIWLPEKMNQDSANKLLKIIEEPFEKTFFLMVSEQPEQIIGTILSRTQRINIPPLSREDLREQLVTEKGCTPEKAEELTHNAAGSWNRVLRLLDESEEQVYCQEKFVSLMRLCWERKMVPVNQWVNELAERGREGQKNFLSHTLRMIRENFIKNFGIKELNYMTEREQQFSMRFSPYVNEKNIIPLTEELEKAYRDISRNGNAKIVFTDLCIKIMQNIRP